MAPVNKKYSKGKMKDKMREALYFTKIENPEKIAKTSNTYTRRNDIFLSGRNIARILVYCNTSRTDRSITKVRKIGENVKKNWPNDSVMSICVPRVRAYTKNLGRRSIAGRAAIMKMIR
ncbi:MAG: hypothetical protein ACLFNK_01380 [Candidatus Woesearchaeota archaeon]